MYARLLHPVYHQEFKVSQHATGGQGVIIYAPETPETRALEEKRKSKGDKESPSNFSHVKNSRKPFTWENLSYTVPSAYPERCRLPWPDSITLKGGANLKLLDDIY